jgi:Fur family transcriptional regulator, peroxide stress response regulator
MNRTDARQRLEEGGIKATHQRLVILEALTETQEHLSAELLHERLRLEQPSLSLGTVYRTLEIFADAGLIRHVSNKQGTMLFDAHLEDHHHIICKDTHEVLDYTDPELSALLSRYFAQKQIPGFEVQYVQLNISARRQPPQG